VRPFLPADYAGVLCMLPHSLRLMYMHAWQSRLWNLAASHRMTVSDVYAEMCEDGE
jgi:tRNA(Glu) U13 pseudouridine synthase TruD